MGHSCITQLTEFQHDILIVLEHNYIVDGLFLDFCKAIDTVSYNLLDIKLFSLNINAKLQTWPHNYFSGCEQRVVLHSKKSSYLKVNLGIPQGSVLGPFLFTVYINYIVDDIKYCINLQMIASSTVTLHQSRTPNYSKMT